MRRERWLKNADFFRSGKVARCQHQQTIGSWDDFDHEI